MNMKKNLLTLVSALLSLSCLAQQQVHYVPTAENLKARQEFADSKLGIFIHWGIYSMFAQGEWYITNANIDNKEYAKAASAFYPIGFNAKEWVSAIKASGAKYICFTSRHTTVSLCGTRSRATSTS
jgi:alpha-L-fucosidase